jgi:hypothetical protein
LTKVAVFLIPVALVVGMAGFDGIGGPPPSQNSPPQNLEIRTWYDLDTVRDNLAGNHTLMNDLDFTTPGYWELASPISNQGEGWEPIGFVERIFWDSPCGGGGSRTDWYGLNGTFDGQGYEIRDLYIDRPTENDVGLFGVVDEGGVIKDISAVNVTVIGDHYIGGLVGRNRGTVGNSYSSGKVDGYHGVGGLVGWNYLGTVSDSYSTGSVTGDWYVGGLVGINNGGTVSNSYSTGNVTGDEDVGGLVGINDQGTVSNSYYNYDEVLINGDSVITIGALSNEDFDQWLAHDKFLDVNERLPQEDGYYVVKNVTDFKGLLAFGQDDSLKFRLANDLDLGDEPDFYIPYLAGEFDGNGHKISNLSFNFDFVSNVGLFGYLASGGKVTHVGVENVNITGYVDIGGLVGRSYGTVSNSYSTGSVTGATDVGGLVGFDNWGTVSDSYSTGSVTGEDAVGGLVGANRGAVSNSHSSSDITGDSYVGGLVGFNLEEGSVSNSYSRGNVTGHEYVGGLVGWNEQGAVEKSYSTGSVTDSSLRGGLVAYNSRGGTVRNSFWDKETSGIDVSDEGTGKNTTEMKNIDTYTKTETEGLDEKWDIADVFPGKPDQSRIWNIVDGATYPFLSWQP